MQISAANLLTTQGTAAKPASAAKTADDFAPLEFKRTSGTQTSSAATPRASAGAALGGLLDITV